MPRRRTLSLLLVETGVGPRNYRSPGMSRTSSNRMMHHAATSFARPLAKFAESRNDSRSTMRSITADGRGWLLSQSSRVIELVSGEKRGHIQRQLGFRRESRNLELAPRGLSKGWRMSSDFSCAQNAMGGNMIILVRAKLLALGLQPKRR